MKRENYTIKANGIIFDTKHAWNSSVRSIERKVQKIANETGQNFKRVDWRANKDESGFYFLSGYFIWKSESETIKFTIDKEINVLS